MKLTLDVSLLIALVNAVFWTGVKITKLEQAKDKATNDIKNLGDKVRQTELKLIYVAMMATPEEKKQEVLNALVRRLT